MRKFMWTIVAIAAGLCLSGQRGFAEDDAPTTTDKKPVVAREAGKQAQQRREKMEELVQQYREVRRLKEAGKHDEAEKAMARLKELRAEVARSAGFAAMPMMNPEMRKRMAEYREKIQAAEKAGDESKVEELKKEVREAMSKHFQRMREQRAAGEGERREAKARVTVFPWPGMDPEARKKMMQLHEKIKAAMKEGDESKVKELKEEAHKMMAKLHAQRQGAAGRDRDRMMNPWAGRFPGGPPHAAGSPEQRFRHLRMAAANLDAAGMKELAAKVRAEGQKLAEQMKHRDSAAVPPAVREQLRRLNEENRKLREQIKRLTRDSDESPEPKKKKKQAKEAHGKKADGKKAEEKSE